MMRKVKMMLEMQLAEPFLGRMVIEIIKEDAQAHIKEKIKAAGTVSDEFLKKFDLGTEVKGKVPFSKGRIVKKSPDCFGSAFKDRFGDVGYIPSEGDIVLFIPNESYKMDPEDRFHLLGDCDVAGYIKKENIKDISLKEPKVEV